MLTDRTIPCGCTSLSELKARRQIEDDGVDEFRSRLRGRLTRVYPHARRISSTNYEPLPFWLAGAQLVALNYQTLDRHVLVNEGLFANENGRSGYVLKPAYVRAGGRFIQALRSRQLPSPRARDRSTPSHENEDELQTLDKNENSPQTEDLRNLASSKSSSSVGSVDGQDSPRTMLDNDEVALQNLRCTVELTVLSGHMLPTPEGNDSAASPMVRISLCGAAEDNRAGETRSIDNNSFNPRWHELFTFQVTRPSVAQLVFEVVDVARNGRQVIAAASFPLVGVREGIRWAPMRDTKHHEIDQCGLLLEVRIRGPWVALRRKQLRKRLREDDLSHGKLQSPRLDRQFPEEVVIDGCEDDDAY